MKILKTLASAMAAALILLTTSCLGDNEGKQPNSWNASIRTTDNFTAVRDMRTGYWTSYAGASISMAYDFDRVAMQLTVANMQIASDKVLTFSLPYMTYSVRNDGTMVLDQTGPFTVTGTNGLTYQISDVYVSLRTPLNIPPIVDINFSIGSEYKVQVMPIYNYYGGVTEITYPDEGSVSTVGKGHFSTQQTYYNMALDYKSQTVSLYMFQPKFADNMPSMLGFIFKDVPFTLSDEGLKFKSDALTPHKITSFGADGSVNSQPEPNFNVTDLEGTMRVAKTLSFQFDCKMGEARFSGTPLTEQPSAN